MINNPIRVFLVDDHLIVREGITAMLEFDNDIAVVGQASNASDAISEITRLSPDVILMDLKMPDVDGIQLTKLLRNRLITSKIIILTLYDRYVSEAMKVGVQGYLLKDISREELIDSIKKVYGGETVYDKKVMPTIKIDYEVNSEEEDEDFSNKDVEESAGDVSDELFEQVRVFILPPADISTSLRLTSILEEALRADFKQVEGTPVDGISIIFRLYIPVPPKEINRRISKVPNIHVINLNESAKGPNMKNLIDKKQAFDKKHPLIITIFIQLNP